jgi:hypothetical protein
VKEVIFLICTSNTDPAIAEIPKASVRIIAEEAPKYNNNSSEPKSSEAKLKKATAKWLWKGDNMWHEYSQYLSYSLKKT